MTKNNNLVLLGGMMCDERLWANQTSDLGDYFDQIMIGDLTRSASIEGMARDVLREAPGRFTLAGLSMGGIVAFEIWRQDPQRITHLALLDTNAAPERPEHQEKRQCEIDSAYDGRLREMMVEEFKPNYLGRRSRADAAILDTVLDMAMRLGVSVFERQSIALRDRPDSRPTLARISCPTIVVCGCEDILCPPDYHELIANGIPQSKLAILDDCGHMPPLEKPDDISCLLVKLGQQQYQQQRIAE